MEREEPASPEHRMIRRHRVEGELMWLAAMGGLAALTRIALRRRRSRASGPRPRPVRRGTR